jgi:hypothetical protein
MSHIISRGRYARETYPKPPTLPAVTPAQFALLTAILDNNVQHVGPYSSAAGVSTPGTTVWLDSPLYTLVDSPTPIGKNAIVGA